jgi:hypothetical protein
MEDRIELPPDAPIKEVQGAGFTISTGAMFSGEWLIAAIEEQDEWFIIYVKLYDIKVLFPAGKINKATVWRVSYKLPTAMAAVAIDRERQSKK